LIKSRLNEDFKITVKYLPPSFQAYNEGKNISGNRSMIFDSLLNQYKNSRTFYLTIEPKNKEEGDILFYGIKSVEEFKDRVMKLNFSPGEFITLKSGKDEFKPVLSNMENLYDIHPKKSLYLVFSDQQDKKLLAADELDFEFDDQIFLTGINHFVFRKKDMDNIPPFDFIKTNKL
jgi:hypothetical protein